MVLPQAISPMMFLPVTRIPLMQDLPPINRGAIAVLFNGSIGTPLFHD